jgi:peptidoglycan/LPS O-acetylase OafA/YrhL
MTRLAECAKACVAVGTAALVAVQALIPMSPTEHGWVAVALAGLGAAAVYRVPNAPAEPAPK